MLPNKMSQLAIQLLSSAARLKWEEGVDQDAFTARLPDVSLVIWRGPLKEIVLDLVNDEGDVIESLSSNGNPQMQTTLQRIHDIARRSVFEIDQNIDKALEYLRRV